MQPNVDNELDLESRPLSPLVGEQSRLYMLLSLALLMLVFALGVVRWVQFSRENGGPVGLFTQTDFPGIVIGSDLVSSGRGDQLYDLDLQLKEQQSIRDAGYLSLSPAESRELKYSYPYTPFLAVLWSPFSSLSPLTSMALWDLLNISAFAGGLWYLLRSLPLSGYTRGAVLLAGITSFPFIQNLEQGQSSGVTMLALAGGITLLRQGRDLPAGLALGLLALKVQWLPLVALVLLWRWRWRSLLGLGSTVVGLLALTALVMGFGWAPGYLQILGQAGQGGRELLLDPLFSHSLSGGIAALLGPGQDGLIRTVSLSALILAAGLLLWLWRGVWLPGTPRWDGLMSLTVLATLFTDLHLNTHDLSLLAVPAALGISYMGTRQSRPAVLSWNVLLWCGYLVPVFLLYTQPVRLTTVVMASMMGLLLVPLARSAGRVNT